MIEEMEELTPLDEIKAQVAEQQRPIENPPAEHVETKAITDLTASDIKFRLDTNKSVEAQAEDVVGAVATAKAVSDEHTAKELADKKAEELKLKAQAKALRAEADSIEAETAKQKAVRTLYEAVLEDFMITKHLPQWLMVALVFLLSPLFIVKTLIISVPFGFGKTLMDCVDNIVCRYEKIDATNKPRVRVSIWVILGVLIVVGIGFVVLKILKKI